MCICLSTLSSTLKKLVYNTEKMNNKKLVVRNVHYIINAHHKKQQLCHFHFTFTSNTLILAKWCNSLYAFKNSVVKKMGLKRRDFFDDVEEALQVQAQL